MSARWIRRPPERKDEAAAALVSAALGVGVALVAYYVVRLMLSREALSSPAPVERGPEE